MSDLIKQRLAENSTTPYMAQHEIVFELIDLEKENELLKEVHGKLLELVEDICKEIDVLKARTADLQKTPSDNAASESPVIGPSTSDSVPALEPSEVVPVDQGIGQENTETTGSSSQTVD